MKKKPAGVLAHRHRVHRIRCHLLALCTTGRDACSRSRAARRGRARGRRPHELCRPRSYTAGDFIRRVVESLLHGECRGQFLCARCLVKLTKDQPGPELREAGRRRGRWKDIFANPGALILAPASLCALCARKKVTCLGGSGPR